MNVGEGLQRAEACPTAARVRQTYAGGGDERQIAEVESHLETCAACNELLASLDADDSPSDAVLQALSALPSCTDDELEFQQLHSTLMTLSPAGGGPRFGSRLADPPIGELPQLLGNYELLARIGRGAWGAIYRARHVKLDQVVAVKLLDSSRLHVAPMIEHFVQEMKAVGQLKHPNIVRATDAGEDRGLHYLVMEHLHGVDAGRLLRKVEQLSVADACEIVRQAAIALDFAHKRSWVHRDVKPSNLMITVGGQVKLLDLGIAGRRDGDSTPAEHESQTPLGTADYMAPEQWKSFATVDARADVYSLGRTLQRLVDGRNAPANHAAGARVDSYHPPETQSHRSGSVVSRPDVRRGLERILQKMLALDPKDRYQSAAEVAEALEPWSRRADLTACVTAVLGEVASPTEIASPRDGAARPRSSSRRANRRAVLLAAASLAGVGWLGRSYFSGSAPRLQRAHWRPLKPMSPEILLTAGSRANVALQRVANGDLSVSSREMALINLGRTIASPFAIRVAIRRDAMQGGAGVYFRWRTGDAAQAAAAFQSIEIVTEREDGQLGVQRVQWIGWSAVSEEGRLTVQRETLAEATAELNPENQQQLQVTLGRSGLPEVLCNDKPLRANSWTLSTEGRRLGNLEPNQLDQAFLGGLGLINVSGVASFHAPELSYL